MRGSMIGICSHARAGWLAPMRARARARMKGRTEEREAQGGVGAASKK